MGTQLLTTQHYATGDQSSGNTSAVNLSKNPTVEEMNRILSYGATGNTTSSTPETRQEPSDTGFGTHIREAVEIVKDWIGND